MATNYKKIETGVNVVPKSTSTSDSLGDIEVLSSTNKATLHNGSSASPIVTEDHTATLTNKTIDADSNTITNIENADIKSGAAIDRDKLATDTVSTVVVNDASGDLDTLALTSAQIIVGDSGGIPAAVSVTGDVTLSDAGVTAISADSIVDADINSAAGIARTKLASGTASHVVVNDGSGIMASTASLDVPRGGTGSTSLTANNVLLGNGASALQTVAPGTSGNVLTSNGATWTSSTPADSSSAAKNINAQTGTTYTFALTDGSNNGNSPLVTLTNASDITATVPPNSSVAFPIGSQIDVIRGGAGDVIFAPGGGVTINSPLSSVTIRERYSQVSLVKTGTDTWDLFGDLEIPGYPSATGGTVTTDGNFKIHTFTTSGTFQINSGSGTISSLVIGGGGGGAGASQGGGGGAGQPVYTTPGTTYGPGSYTVSIGAGGVGGSSNTNGTNGSSSTFDVITAVGGGGGGYAGQTGLNGASGGGGGSSGIGGTSTASPGFAGGNGYSGAGTDAGGGGGGAGGVGTNGANSVGGNGGLGISNSISGSAVFYASGGGGSTSGAVQGTTTPGGGGAGGAAGGVAGAANTGGGGGGAGGAGSGGNGGSGIVILRYQYQ